MTRTKKEVEAFKTRYLELVDTLDRPSSHQEALSKSFSRGRMPAKLKIAISPMVINKDNPTFVANWENACRESEKQLTQMIIDHLGNTITKTNLAIRSLSKEGFHSLKEIDKLRKFSGAIVQLSSFDLSWLGEYPSLRILLLVSHTLGITRTNVY